MPNTPISDEKKEEIERLAGRFNIGYIAKKIDAHPDTVKKYIKMMDDQENH